MNLDDLKKHLVDICHCASERWLTAGSGGNISVRIPNTSRYLCTATGVTFRDTAVENIVEMDLDGTQVGGGPWKPSKEHRWHAGILAIRPEVGGVVHELGKELFRIRGLLPFKSPTDRDGRGDELQRIFDVVRIAEANRIVG